jgi:aspartate/methionine/tyrosine aminotransferase
MFARTRYIQWALEHYGKVEYDLATSGVPLVKWEEIAASVPKIDDPAGFQRARESIAQYNQVATSEVVPALGTSGALFLAYAACVSPGDDVLVETPGYEPLTRAAEGAGAIVRTFERRADESFRVVADRVAAAVGPRTRAIAVTNLHNPTGVRIDDATLLDLAHIADARGAYLIVDEVYAPFDDLAEDGVFRGSARKLAPNVIAVGSLTKCYGLGMHRIGWLLGPPEIVERAEAASIATVGHLSLPHANLAVSAFGAVGALSRRAKSLVSGKKAIAEKWLAKHPRAKWSAPANGIFGLVTVDVAADLRPQIEHLAKEKGVLVAAGSFFGVPNGFRLSWATCDAERFEAALTQVSSLIS